MIEQYRIALREMIGALEREFGVVEAFPVTVNLSQAYTGMAKLHAKSLTRFDVPEEAV